MTENNGTLATAGDPRGIAGWLILPAVGIIGIVFWSSYGFMTGVLQAAAAWSSLTVHWRATLVVVFILDFAFVLLAVVTALKFFGRRRSAPHLYIAVLVFNLFSGLILLALLNERDAIRDLVRSIIGAAIWIPYFLISKRVRATFVE